MKKNIKKFFQVYFESIYFGLVCFPKENNKKLPKLIFYAN